MADSILQAAWFYVSGISAIASVSLLVFSHVFEAHLGARIRRLIDIAAAPLFVVFLTYVVARPFA